MATQGDKLISCLIDHKGDHIRSFCSRCCEYFNIGLLGPFFYVYKHIIIIRRCNFETNKNCCDDDVTKNKEEGIMQCVILHLIHYQVPNYSRARA